MSAVIDRSNTVGRETPTYLTDGRTVASWLLTTDHKRIALRRRGREHLVIPERLRLVQGREVITTRHPSTGHRMELFVDEIDAVDPVG